MKKQLAGLFITVFLIVLILGAAAVIYVQVRFANKEEVRNATIEMREYSVSTKIPGRIEWIAVDEGDVVDVNQEIFKVTSKEIEAKVEQASGAVQSAQAQYNIARNYTRPEQLNMAKQSYEAAKSQYDLAKKSYDRMKKLADEKLISLQELDVISQKLEAATAQMQAAKSQYEMATTGARPEEKNMALGQVLRAKGSLAEASSYLDETIVRTVVGGVISKRYVNSGELVSTGFPVVTVIDTTDFWAELSLPATELEKIKLGQILKGRVNGLGKDVDFKVVNYSAMGEYSNWRTTTENSTFDVRTFAVKLKSTEPVLAGLRPGMTVTFNFDNKKINKK
ncbi:MAG: HlyD family efflux transporter periplasmic adaptor subunit [Bacteroidetes bacterium]|nr:HlyD family efflux transporter periplasmic adaptor subunit [Bacteroidota bacterium]